MLPRFSYVCASTLNEAVRALSHGDSRLHAGGTDLLGCLREGIFSADTVVSISRLKGLEGIAETAHGGLRIGALTTIAEVAGHRLVRERYPGLAKAASEVASPQLRNQGTLAGNLCQKPRCWYYRGEFDCIRKGGGQCFAVDGENQYHCVFGGDPCYVVHPSGTAPALIALKASLGIVGQNGPSRLPLEELFVAPVFDPERETVLEPGQIITEIDLPAPSPGLRSSYRKVRARRSWDFALAGVALALAFDGDVVREARVVLSGVAPVPWRSRPVEEVITGRRLAPDVLARAQDAAVADAEPLEHNGYKIPLVRAIIAEELEAIARS